MIGTSETMKKWGVFIALAALISIVLPFFIYSLIPSRRVEKRYVIRDIETIEDMIKHGSISITDGNLLKNMVRELEYLKVSLPNKFHRMDFFMKAQPILSKANDQNTEITFGLPSYYPVLPFKARFINGKLFVIESVDKSLAMGDEIVNIGGKDMKDFFRYLKRFVSADSSALLYKKMEDILWRLPSIERKEKYTLWVKGKGEIVVSYIPKKTYIEKLREIKGHEWDYKFDIQGNIGILRFKTFNLYGQDIQDLEDNLKNAASMHLKYFIIDVRDCTGGSLRIPFNVLGYFVDNDAKFKRSYVFRPSKYCGDDGNVKSQGINRKYSKEYIIFPKEVKINAKLIVLVDRTTSNEALDFAYMIERLKLGEVYGEIPDQGLGHTFMKIRKFLPSVKMIASTSCARWDDKGKLKVTNAFKLSQRDYVAFIGGKSDVLLQKILRKLGYIEQQ